ncbi:glycosyltransferase family 61 protein [uncultured Shewanella sp.]|uniref:glycosyltransferase family 61 protein n=1 Tax=uncultured Shewanella sp. TaxID=173975 RepID=UPI002603ABEF|nr:glycosyltransferase family 61 protein [uncultured Shewanella sp.]
MESWFKPFDLRKTDEYDKVSAKLTKFEDKKLLHFNIESVFSSADDVNENNLGDIFNSSYETHPIFLSELSDVLVGPKPKGLPRYWPMFTKDIYVWNILSEEAKFRLKSQGEIKLEDDLIKPASSVPYNLELKGTFVWLYIFDNIDHLYRETLPAILLLKESSYEFDKLIFIVPKINSELEEILTTIGVNVKNIIKLPNTWFKVEKIIIPSFITFGHLHTPSTWYLKSSKLLREEIINKNIESTKKPPKKIFVSRENATQRKILNENEIIDKFKKMGFTVIDPGEMSKSEQILFFSEAEEIVGPHGMGIANTIFSNKLTLLLELMPTDWNRVSYFRNAQLQNASYGCYWMNPITQPNSRKQKREYLIDCENVIHLYNRLKKLTSDNDSIKSTDLNSYKCLTKSYRIF